MRCYIVCNYDIEACAFALEILITQHQGLEIDIHGLKVRGDIWYITKAMYVIEMIS